MPVLVVSQWGECRFPRGQKQERSGKKQEFTKHEHKQKKKQVRATRTCTVCKTLYTSTSYPTIKNFQDNRTAGCVCCNIHAGWRHVLGHLSLSLYLFIYLSPSLPLSVSLHSSLPLSVSLSLSLPPYLPPSLPPSLCISPSLPPSPPLPLYHMLTEWTQLCSDNTSRSSAHHIRLLQDSRYRLPIVVLVTRVHTTSKWGPGAPTHDWVVFVTHRH